MRKKVFFALGCVLYLTGCDSSSLEKVIPKYVTPSNMWYSKTKILLH